MAGFLYGARWPRQPFASRRRPASRPGHVILPPRRRAVNQRRLRAGCASSLRLGGEVAAAAAAGPAETAEGTAVVEVQRRRRAFARPRVPSRRDMAFAGTGFPARSTFGSGVAGSGALDLAEGPDIMPGASKRAVAPRRTAPAVVCPGRVE
ncbi:hypothetical protein CDD83_4430 [Cordyceps sp. RAO-2017]|nr:hypothetical protein CDD83_4430 [Cordyceps sp. RAO-2017]